MNTNHVARRLLLTRPGEVEIVADQLQPLDAGQILARSIISGISHGTELAWLRGTAAALDRSWDPIGRVFLAGPGRGYPVAPGYDVIGRIIACGSQVHTVTEGDLVRLDRPHADLHVVDASTANAGRLPGGVHPDRALFWTLVRVALGGVHDAEVRLGEVVVVTGLGTVGLLVGQLAQLAGASQVIGADPYPLRVKMATDLGITGITCTSNDLAVQVRALTGGVGADVAIETSGSYLGLHEAIRCCRIGGRVATVASYHGDQAGLRLGEEYHRNRITLVSSMTVNGCAQRGHPAWTLDRLDSVARELVNTGQIQVEPLITHRIPFHDAAEAYRLILDTPQDTIRVVLTYDSPD
ncbi:MAG: zinc-binding alcohol dehydrogenase [Sporichthyaceae bacterium]|nr:zinc-binding alcohol dehydrogenase [Sporichthyaceae bacterium]